MSPNSLSAAKFGSGYISSLDGWRALSICFVLGGHSLVVPGFPPNWTSAFSWLFDGNFGVRIFFIISGFLITTLMLREHEAHGSINLRSFYARRALRILPVYGAFLGCVALLQAFTDYSQKSTEWFHLLTFTSNFYDARTWLTGHTWSLSCEEQFYIIWPALLVCAGLTAHLRKAVLWLCIPLLLCPLWRVGTYLGRFHGNPLFDTYSIFNYLDGLTVGCLLAFFQPRMKTYWESKIPLGPLLLCLALVVFPHVLQHLLIAGILTVPLGPLIQAIGIAGLLSMSMAKPNWWGFRWLNLKPIRWIGRISYSLYIWQQFFCTSRSAFGWPESVWFAFPLWIVLAFGAATISFYGIEKPLLKLRNHLRIQSPLPPTG